MENFDKKWDSTLEQRLLSSQLVSEIRKSSEGITLVFTGLGTKCLIETLLQRGKEEKEADMVTESNESLPEFLETKDAVELLSVCTTTLYLWRKSGYLPFTKTGRKVKYRKKDIIDLLTKRLKNEK